MYAKCFRGGNASACVWVLIETAVEEIACGGVSAQGGSHIAHILLTFRSHFYRRRCCHCGHRHQPQRKGLSSLVSLFLVDTSSTRFWLVMCIVVLECAQTMHDL